MCAQIFPSALDNPSGNLTFFYKHCIPESTLNRASRKVNISDLHLADPLGILLENYIPVMHWGRNVGLIFNPNLLPD